MTDDDDPAASLARSLARSANLKSANPRQRKSRPLYFLYRDDQQRTRLCTLSATDVKLSVTADVKLSATDVKLSTTGVQLV
jgi:hypothetical protein